MKEDVPLTDLPIAEGGREELARAAEFRVAVRRFLARTDALTKKAQLTSRQYTLLLVIKAAPGEAATVTELAERLHMSQPAATQLVQRAEETGLVTRERSRGDGRVVVVRPTPAGERRLMQAFRALRADREAVARAFRQADARLRALSRRD